jgi:hypothetical protein
MFPRVTRHRRHVYAICGKMGVVYVLMCTYIFFVCGYVSAGGAASAACVYGSTVYGNES